MHRAFLPVCELWCELRDSIYQFLQLNFRRYLEQRFKGKSISRPKTQLLTSEKHPSVLWNLQSYKLFAKAGIHLNTAIRYPIKVANFTIPWQPSNIYTRTQGHDTFRFTLANSEANLVINSLINELFGFDLRVRWNTQKSNPHHP